MDDKTLALISRLPKKSLLEAARAHLQNLALEGRLAEAREMYDELLSVDDKNLATARAGRLLVGRFCLRGDFDAALEIYGNFPDARENHDILLEQLMTCDLIVRHMAGTRTLEAWEIWRPLAESLSSDAAKQNWTRTGEALMDACYKNDLVRLGKEIYASLLEFASCDAARGYLERAALTRRKLEG
ncbi:MAG: hypothetical protein HDQ93_06530 [Desulfovibrio sp.]|nr:hypothetical protein [Desulfovibrio sp.]